MALNGQLQETIDLQRTLADDLQNILCNTNVATIFLDMENHIRFFTPATRSLFNMLPSDVGRAFSDLAAIAPDPTLMADIAAVRAGSHPTETEIEAEDGICYSRRVLPYRVHDNQTEGVIVTYTDVTDRKRAERSIHEARVSAESANLAKSRFLAAASHDLRQPLQSLALVQELLARKVKERDCQQLLARLERTLESMSAMLDGLLDINRIKADSVEIAPGCLPLDALLAEEVQGLSLQALASNTGAVKSERVAAEARLVALTERQREVMAMVLDGHPSKIIAADLNLSQCTVEHHRAEIMHRTGCRSLPELARLVMAASSGDIRQS